MATSAFILEMPMRDFLKIVLKLGAKLEPGQMFGYLVNSVAVDEVDQVELKWQDYNRFQSKFRVTLSKVSTT